MTLLGPLGFTAPWLLLGLVLLPILWLILRAVPPAPIRRRFPAVALLLGLGDEESQSDRTPWWLLLLRLAALGLVILGFAGPVLNPSERTPGDGPLLILADASWADAPDWPARTDRIEALLAEARRLGRPTALVALTDPPAEAPVFGPAEALAQSLPGVQPRPWEPQDLTAFAASLEGPFETYWLSDGLERASRAPLLSLLQSHGPVSVFQTPRSIVALRPLAAEEGEVVLRATRTPVGPDLTVTAAAVGLDPSGTERPLAEAELSFAPGEAEAEVRLDLPPELRNRLTRVELPGRRSAAAVQLTGDALRRREIALLAGGTSDELPELLSPLHYLHEALEPSADLIEGTLGDIVLANPDAIILADVAEISPEETQALEAWVEDGGLLLRFAGPRLAAADVAVGETDPLLPVRLRAGGRSVGGAMSWGEPKALAPFEPGSPFFGLPVPPDVEVSAQVLAEPGPELAARVVAELADGTPLVTRREVGAGQVILFHVTANAEWSSLPLSGLFVQMLERLALTAGAPAEQAEALEGTIWQPEQLIDAFGRLAPADDLPGVPGARLAAGTPGPELLPGLYSSGERALAINVGSEEMSLAPATWPADVPVEGLAARAELPLQGWLLAVALGLLLLDMIASLALSGRLRGGGRGTGRGAAAALAIVLLSALPPGPARAQEGEAPAETGTDLFAEIATSEVVLAHVLTGDDTVDELAEAGLLGLSRTLFARTSVEPGPPMGVDIEADELAFFPLLYWPVTADMALPSPAAYDKLNRYLAGGGMIVFDTRDSDLGTFGGSTPEGRMLQALARPLNIPPLEPLPADHVLTRTFYLLQDFPGRFASHDVWVEASTPDAEQLEGMPFRNLNDGVTPVVIGGNDWAAAWAVDEIGAPLLPIGRGQAGDRQRELALRFGVNLVMHVLTGNYKSDQVHVPALLERLGN
ncbi:DUF4159 domain-containing protein [Pseudoroseicyclus tamaricis]|uniref:DUF4159 domain-containing protein n=1 Tax=Pseudoroseicyclus tamaricis TaxID=2705421 RepID=A0A6B2JU19_9RHOB|nr:DUF4159 domain-containing protein [Pseudoroseicyclus tamaricis]NDU99673.1 DUF4159 domain-containing protein [Pseudoroseicyclus tamaricis]